MCSDRLRASSVMGGSMPLAIYIGGVLCQAQRGDQMSHLSILHSRERSCESLSAPPYLITFMVHSLTHFIFSNRDVIHLSAIVRPTPSRSLLTHPLSRAPEDSQSCAFRPVHDHANCN